MLKHCSKILCAFMISGVPTTVCANMDSSGFQLSAYGGLAVTDINNSSYTLLGNQVEVLAPTNANSYDFAWGFGAAYRLLVSKFLHDISVGLDMFYLPDSQDGDVLSYGMFDNSTYQLKFRSIRLMADSDWTFRPIYSRFYPFISVGIGFTANTMSFNSSPEPDATWEVGQSMSNNQIFQFAYNVGGGIKVPLTNKVALSLRYLYAGLGSARTDASTASLPTTAGINTPVASQNVLVGLSYLL